MDVGTGQVFDPNATMEKTCVDPHSFNPTVQGSVHSPSVCLVICLSVWCRVRGPVPQNHSYHHVSGIARQLGLFLQTV